MQPAEGHGAEQHASDEHGHGQHAHDDHHGPVEPHESPWVVTLPLVLLAIPSVLVGFFTAGPMLFGTDWSGHEKQLPFFLGAIDVPAVRDTVGALAKEFHGPVAFALHGFQTPTFWFALGGFLLATLMYLLKPESPRRRAACSPRRSACSRTNTAWTTCGSTASPAAASLGRVSRLFDTHVIDGVMVNGSARVVDFVARMSRHVQSGYLYHYAFAMILGLIALLAVLIRALY